VWFVVASMADVAGWARLYVLSELEWTCHAAVILFLNLFPLFGRLVLVLVLVLSQPVSSVGT
jgi:hypothetical protein